nr:calpain-7-like [Leptinotarsa decemlineata]
MSEAISLDHLVRNGIEASKKAVHFDFHGDINISAHYYEATAYLLELAAQGISDSDELKRRAYEYKTRCVALRNNMSKVNPIQKDETRSKLKQCHFLLQQAIEEDEKGDKADAIQLYAKAVGYISQFPELRNTVLKKVTLQALDRAEELKGILRAQPSTSSTNSPTPTTSTVQQQPSTYSESVKKPDLHRGTSAHLKVSGGDNYTKDFKQFIRPEDISRDPCIVHGPAPNYLTIKQTVISDCSFVASLAVSASYEKRFGKKLVTSIIYPQSKDQRPLYNPFGKYMIKLHINGIPRKIIIDDTLPVDEKGRLLCSYSSNKNEFWISLLEKAYMKVMGGYDFPGSNSNIDLHALTGWIPERFAIKSKNPEFNKYTFFDTLEARLEQGEVLATVATGELVEYDVERSGLVPTHAYAVIDAKKLKGVRLLKLKNPWSHMRWRGNFSELDAKNWTPELQSILNYDPNSAAHFDNGVFWIDYESVCKFFEVFYMNWNPELFNFTYCLHQSWNAGTGPAKDLYSVGSNPQYSLFVSGNAPGAVWLLLTRHIVDIEDFRENKEYITLFVYKNGKKVYYPYDPPPYIDGVKINSPHYLCKIILGPKSERSYTIVVSQYEKTTTIYYTLRAYSTCPFDLRKIEDPYKFEMKAIGEWRGITAGGCPNHPLSYPYNPKYRIEIESVWHSNQLLIELKGPKQYQIGFEVIFVHVNDPQITAPFKTISSGSYRYGYVVLELENIPAGTLKVMPSTFMPNQEGPFILQIKSSAMIHLFTI